LLKHYCCYNPIVNKKITLEAVVKEMFRDSTARFLTLLGLLFLLVAFFIFLNLSKEKPKPEKKYYVNKYLPIDRPLEYRQAV